MMRANKNTYDLKKSFSQKILHWQFPSIICTYTNVAELPV